MYKILAINPGSTSTKIACFSNEQLQIRETLDHHPDEIDPRLHREAQVLIRRNALQDFLKKQSLELSYFSAMVVRGGLLKPLVSGTYLVNEDAYNDLINARYGWHASNLGIIIAFPLARYHSIPLYTVDPVTVDEFEPPARYSGCSGMTRASMSHALNMKAVARRAAEKLGKPYTGLNLVVAHLGSGISISAHKQGRMIDVNNANEEGPFALERCGTLPALSLVRFCFDSGYTRDEAINLLTTRAGLYSYLGTKDFRLVEKMVRQGDAKASEAVYAMAYQIAKEIGAMASVLDGKVDSVVFTGGMAHSEMLTNMIKEKISYIAPVIIIPGEEELKALAAGALRVLRGEEELLLY